MIWKVIKVSLVQKLRDYWLRGRSKTARYATNSEKRSVGHECACVFFANFYRFWVVLTKTMQFYNDKNRIRFVNTSKIFTHTKLNRLMLRNMDLEALLDYDSFDSRSLISGNSRLYLVTRMKSYMDLLNPKTGRLFRSATKSGKMDRLPIGINT